VTSPNLLRFYTRFAFRDGRWTRLVFRRGSGPAVIVMHDMPGLSPLVVRFADHVVEAGMTAFLPSLFGQPGKPSSSGYTCREVVKAICIRREFTVWATNRSSPIVDWLRALARQVHGECGGRGVGAVGMCFTGGFALAMMTEPSVTAPVLSQPSLPIPFGSRKRASSMGVSDEEVACASARFTQENLSMMGLRFAGDRLVPDARVETYRRTFGDKFEYIELDPKDAAPAPIAPHAVLTLHLDDRPGTPTKNAEERVIAFLKQRTSA
jgi:dienelactone hydrolase